jgi:DNA polymerase-3 subunit epsilon
MVRASPTFKEIAGDLYSQLEGTVLVAHNCRFDYGFLKAEFSRLGATLRLRTMCTVKLSKRLYPTANGHSLDAIMQRFSLHTDARHRAMGDTVLMLDFLEAAERDLGSIKILEAINHQIKGPALPPSIDDSFLKTIEDVPGAYIFYDEHGLPLYIGKSVKLRTRVLSHFSSDHKSATEMEMTQKVRRVEWKEKSGELGALLLEAKLIKQMKPAYNRLLRNVTKLYSIRMSTQMNDLPWLRIVSIDDVDPENLEFMYGIFKTKKTAKELINNLIDEFNLCTKLLGVEKGKGKCFGNQVKKCTGVCIGEEKHELHHLRLRQAMIKHKIKSWPYDGRIGIREVNPDTETAEVHIFEHWCHLESVDNDADLSASISTRYHKKFDIDFYRLIQKALTDQQDLLFLKAA